MGYFEYEVRVYEESMVVENQLDKMIYCGVVCADSYPDAIIKVIDYYGKAAVIDVRLSEWDCSDYIIQISKSVLDELREDEGDGIKI